jgi:decaprenylphospho-beta-D-erythro-pentofuranosid-2-ulose 2-reductase
MIVLGSNSDVSRAFVELILQKEQLENLYLFSSNTEQTEVFKKHLLVKYNTNIKVIDLDLMNFTTYDFSTLNYDKVFCASGYLGKDGDDVLERQDDNDRILKVNYAQLVLVLNAISKELIKKGKGTLIVLSSVAGERGRKSNFMYGSAKAGLTAYLSGLRNFLFSHKIHVLTVKPGFMNTKMTENLDLPKPLTISPEKAASLIYKGYKKKKNTIYIGPIWRLIMFIIRNIPEFIFKKMSL